MNVVAVCSDGTRALEAIRKWSPDVAVLDIAMPGLSGLDVLATIAADGLATKVVLLAATASDEQIARAVAGGGTRHRAKRRRSLSSFKVSALSPKGASGCPWLGSMQHSNVKANGGRRANGLTQLMTIRERQVVLLIADGLSNKEVGRRLDLSEGTVKIHLHNIYQKLHVNNRTTLAALAIAHRNDLALPGENVRS